MEPGDFPEAIDRFVASQIERPNPLLCEHVDFDVVFQIERVAPKETLANGLQARVSLSCTACRQIFFFTGIGHKPENGHAPHAEKLGTEVCLPIAVFYGMVPGSDHAPA